MTAPRPLIAIYARYSSDLQNPSSVDDQIALCKRLVADQFKADPDKVLVFSDAAISGATMERPGIKRLLSALQSRRIGMVVAEGLDRLSRSLKDIAAIHDHLTYHNAQIWTAHEGQVTDLHVGLKGTMNAMFLKDMKAKVKRGQAARVAAGFSAGSCAYGYRVVRGVVDGKGRNVNGIREIDPEAASVIERIYREYVDGRGIAEIVQGLNAEGIPAPNGGLWKRNALMGGAAKQEGILRNEIYTGKLIANRHYVVRDPITNKKKFVLNPESEWKKVEVPHLRIVSDKMWEQARFLDRPRSPEPKQKIRKTPPLLKKHNQHAITGWVKCGWCGGAKSLAHETRYMCSTYRYARNCKNARGTKEEELNKAVFEALRTRILDGLDFRQALIKSMENETRQKEILRRQEDKLKARIERLLDAVERGINATDRILILQNELADVKRQLKAAASPMAPNEEVIRTTFLDAIDRIAREGDVVTTAQMFHCLLKEVVLTPIPDARHGETISVHLREEGWPEFWRLVVDGGM